MPSDILPFRMAGNLYFVGTRAQSSHLIDTGDGLILMDVGDEANADFVLESIATLGFDVKNVKHILLTHGHYDHSHGTMKIKEKCGAPVYLFEPDVKYLNGFLPDVYLKDGDVIRQGNTEILCLFTPGHTEGTASYFFDLTEDGKTLEVDEGGHIKGHEDMISGLKTQAPNIFKKAGGVKVEENPLPAGKTGGMTRAEFMRKPYAERAAFASENPDAYKELMKN